MNHKVATPAGGDMGKQETVKMKVNPFDRDPTNPETWGKVMRNDPCPCGSGKKYKHCCGKEV